MLPRFARLSLYIWCIVDSFRIQIIIENKLEITREKYVHIKPRVNNVDNLKFYQLLLGVIASVLLLLFNNDIGK